MDVLVIGHADVRRLLPMAACVEVMERAFRSRAAGHTVLPLRTALRLPDRRGLLGLMPAQVEGEAIAGGGSAMGIKVVSVFPENAATRYESHQGAVLLFETANGCLQAIVDAAEITTIRTAAASALATRVLARPDAGDLALLGTGTQAESHLEAMQVVRTLRRVRVWGRTPAKVSDFVRRHSERLGIAIEPVASARDAVQGADLICTTTAARTPVLLGEWLAPGAHVNAVGACFPASRELDTEAVRRSRLFVDCRESALHEAGDFLIPKQEGALDDSHILGELNDVLVGNVRGRTSPADITLFKSLGIGVEDVAAVHYLYEQAKRQGAGARVDLGGMRRAAD
jgi:ornithine cyclodeaminase/alanine dehydrogenase-like protein (mu-crystallin family)